MITASRLAGLFASHAIWCVSDGDPLVPILAFKTGDQEHRMERLLIDESIADSIAFGKDKLLNNEMDADDAVLLFGGGCITIGDEKYHAIIVEMRSYFSLDSEAIIAVPFTPRSSGSFLVHKPKILVWKNCGEFDMDLAMQAFFEGVNSHEEGAKIWHQCLDESR